MIQLHKFYLAIPYKSANFVVLATLEISTRIFFVANIALIVRVIDITDAVNIDRKIRTIYTTRTVRAVPAPHTEVAVKSIALIVGPASQTTRNQPLTGIKSL